MPATTRAARILLFDDREAGVRLLRRGVCSMLPPRPCSTVAGRLLAVPPIGPYPDEWRLDDGSV